jgi:hypothetical protein
MPLSSCYPSRSPTALYVHTVTRPYVSHVMRGQIFLFIEGSSPFRIVVRKGGAVISENRTCIADVEEGTYDVEVEDGSGDQVTISVDVDKFDLPCIVGYVTTPCSSGNSRDGTVSVISEGHIDSDVEWKWSNGVTTREKTLHHTPPGTYTCSPIKPDGCAFPFVHCTSPAVVR